MLNYIKAELYRTFNRKYFYFFTGILAVLALGLNILLKLVGTKDNVTLINAIALPVTDYLLLFPILLLVMIVDMIYTEEYKNGTLKNVVSFGMSRSKLVFGKFIAIIILAFIAYFFVLITFFVSSAVIFGIGHYSNRISPITYFNIIATRYCAGILLWVAVIAVSLLVSIFVNSYNTFIYSYIGIFLILPIAINLLSRIIDKNIAKINYFLITGCISLVSTYNGVDKGDVFWAIAVGLVYIVVCLSLSVVWFSKKDVK